ncbi:hypothetical protein KP509_30G008200 [Ceratopteris richardii]|uniref:Uncharacterized protein n=1 Tax=Ceratopteris richardii TaxID=49495 RepID=A0A8T2R1G4_CERRI|nr:hypothetical protein KP509_30G008200 [Ceratopteris richardii]
MARNETIIGLTTKKRAYEHAARGRQFLSLMVPLSSCLLRDRLLQILYTVELWVIFLTSTEKRVATLRTSTAITMPRLLQKNPTPSKPSGHISRGMPRKDSAKSRERERERSSLTHSESERAKNLPRELSVKEVW